MYTPDGDIWIGTSGWQYDHWRGRFYPDKLPKSRWFEHYARHFDTVEVNSTFYHLPRAGTVEKWRRQAPEGFTYVVKANRYITHIKKLAEVAEEVGRFFEVVDRFEDRLGAVLYQVPPSLHRDLERLDAFINYLPERSRAVFEFRHSSWYDDTTFDLLNRRRVAFCVHDMAGNPSPRVVTGEVVYVRFHGTTGRYAGNYPDALLTEWAGWLKDQQKNVRAVYAYFNNDVEGHAVHNAGTLRKFLTS